MENFSIPGLSYNDQDVLDKLVNNFGVNRTIINEAINVLNSLKNLKTGTYVPSVINILMDYGLLSRDIVYEAIALSKGYSFMDTTTAMNMANFKTFKNENFAKCFKNANGEVQLDYILKLILDSKVFPIAEKPDGTFIIIQTSVDDLATQHAVTFMKQLKDIRYELYLVADTLFNEFKRQYSMIETEELRKFAENLATDEVGSINATDFLRYLLCFAILNKLSDIHVSPSKNGMARIGVRRYGTIETLFYIRLSAYQKLLNVVKMSADIKTDLTAKPKDGRIDGNKLLQDVEIILHRPNALINETYGLNENRLRYSFPQVSFRVSTYPIQPADNYTDDGVLAYEKLVIRVLNNSEGVVPLKNLGLSQQPIDELNFAKNRAQGIILVTGPTGSGKSTSMYSMLSSLNPVEKNIITFEDPVEMRQSYWAQGQRIQKVDDVNDESFFEYADANRSILRQDPDIILMGEVRDEDSANFAITSANTGHLVFTTIHANSAASAVSRIKKLGVSPIEFASALIIIVGQRLVRRLCPHCKKEVQLSDEQKTNILRISGDDSGSSLSKYENLRFFAKGGVDVNNKPCSFCGGRGYVGVVAINEVIPANEEIKRIIIDNGTDFDVRREADKQGYHTMLEDGLAKAAAPQQNADLGKQGIISVDDLLKVL